MGPLEVSDENEIQGSSVRDQDDGGRDGTGTVPERAGGEVITIVPNVNSDRPGMFSYVDFLLIVEKLK